MEQWSRFSHCCITSPHTHPSRQDLSDWARAWQEVCSLFKHRVDLATSIKVSTWRIAVCEFVDQWNSYAYPFEYSRGQSLHNTRCNGWRAFELGEDWRAFLSERIQVKTQGASLSASPSMISDGSNLQQILVLTILPSHLTLDHSLRLHQRVAQHIENKHLTLDGLRYSDGDSWSTRLESKMTIISPIRCNRGMSSHCSTWFRRLPE